MLRGYFHTKDTYYYFHAKDDYMYGLCKEYFNATAMNIARCFLNLKEFNRINNNDYRASAINGFNLMYNLGILNYRHIATCSSDIEFIYQVLYFCS